MDNKSTVERGLPLKNKHFSVELPLEVCYYKVD